jgi:hypothetical protein
VLQQLHGTVLLTLRVNCGGIGGEHVHIADFSGAFSQAAEVLQNGFVRAV